MNQYGGRSFLTTMGRCGRRFFPRIISLPSLVAQLCRFFFSSRRRHTRFDCDWISDVCSSDLSSMARSRSVTAAARSGFGRTYAHQPNPDLAAAVTDLDLAIELFEAMEARPSLARDRKSVV